MCVKVKSASASVGGTSTSQKGFSSVLNENLDGDGMDEDDAIDEI